MTIFKDKGVEMLVFPHFWSRLARPENPDPVLGPGSLF